jgi:hypothetical protein
MNEVPEDPLEGRDRWSLIRDIAVLQVKLVVDGFRDLLLVPASLSVGIISLASGEDGKPGAQFYRRLILGKQSEHWINLFGALRNAPPDLRHPELFPDADMDEIVGRIEAFVIDEEKRGGITTQAKKRFDQALDALHRRGKAGP